MEDWKKDLKSHFKEQKQTKKEIKEKQKAIKGEAKKFMHKSVLPAFEELKSELKKYKRDCTLNINKNRAALVVKKNKRKEFVYEVNLANYSDELQANKSVYLPNEKGKLKLGVEGKIRNSHNALRPKMITKEDIIADFLEEYKQATRLGNTGR